MPTTPTRATGSDHNQPMVGTAHPTDHNPRSTPQRITQASYPAALAKSRPAIAEITC